MKSANNNIDNNRDIIKFYCPHCDQKLSIEEVDQDITISCPACSEKIHIPGKKNEPSLSKSQNNISTFTAGKTKKNTKNSKTKLKRSLKTQSKSEQTISTSRKKSSLLLSLSLVFVLIVVFTFIFLNTNSFPEQPARELLVNNKNSSALNITFDRDVDNEFITQVKPFMQKYCFDCHNQDKQKGDMRLDNLNFDLNEHDSVYIWKDILDVLNGGEMPPKKELQPQSAEMKQVISSITYQLQQAQRKLTATGGVIKMRHLNQREYYASIKDLFGYDLPERLMFKDISPHYDTNGSDQFFSVVAFKKYLSLGQLIAYNNLKLYSQKKSEPKTVRYEPEKKKNNYYQKRLADQLKFQEQVENGATYKDLAYKDEGKFLLEKRRGPNRISTAKEYLETPEHKFGCTQPISIPTKLVRGAKYKLIIGAGSLEKNTTPIEVQLMANSTNYGVVSLKSINDKTQNVELPLDGDIYTSKLVLKLSLPNRKEGTFIDYVEIKGPYPQAPSFAEGIFLPLLTKKKLSDEQVASAIKKFALRAFRYQTGNDDFIHAIIKRYKQSRNSPDYNALDSLTNTISLILSSPSFLYITEKNEGSRQTLSQREYAIRLAYFLWGSPPDDTLYELAKSKKLYDPETLEKQFNRMMSSEKANDFLSSFINQWANIKRFDEVDLPERISANFRNSARKELSEFFKVLVHENLPVDKLIDSDFVVVDKVLATYYGIGDKFNSEEQGFKKLSLASSQPRGGLLSQAAFLITGSSGQRTSPTIRGTIIRSLFLHNPPPEPPANVPEIEEAKAGLIRVKELVEHHKSLPQCSSCHDKIDPIGLGLENFDRFGKWREDETLIVGRFNKKKKTTKNFPIDTHGYISEKEKFSDFRGLKKALLNNKNKLAESLYSSLLSYGIGRKIEFVDEKEIKQVLSSSAKNNYRLKDMLLKLINSKTFKTK